MANLGVDTGGTFTDFVFFKRGRLTNFKMLSSRAHPAQAVLDGCHRLMSKGEKLNLVHGTTVATNALLEGKPARVALITTQGFEDLLEIGRQNRAELYNLFVEKPKPLVPTPHRFGIAERVTVGGEILKPILEQEIEALLPRIEKRKVDALAICLLNSFAHPGHEKMIAEMARALSLPVCASHQVVPEFREYERLTTTVINAALIPIVSRYLETLEKGLPGVPLRIMQSNGGSMTSQAARVLPVRTIFSGPAGGVAGAKAVAEAAGFKKIITFDMGGTSTDVCLLTGEIKTVSETRLGPWPLKTPVIDILSVGAGGGSIARVDPGGALRVGPESAGADPGPLCYGRGRQVTVTDAHLFLGRMDPRGFLGGQMPLAVERIPPGLAKLSRRLNLTLEATAQGIIQVANSTMERALRVISLERGHDPRDFTLVAFGGAGGLHACALARRLSMPRVLIPRDPGTLSALGMLLSDICKDYSRTVLAKLHRLRPGELDQLLAPLAERGEEELAAEGVDPAKITLSASLDMRYEGQGYELNLPVRFPRVKVIPTEVETDFHQLHLKTYGYNHPARECEVVTLRLHAVGKVPKPRFRAWQAGKQANFVSLGRGRLYFQGRWREVPIYHRDDLAAGFSLTGPALILEYSASHFLPPGFRLQVDYWGNLLITVPREKKSQPGQEQYD